MHYSLRVLFAVQTAICIADTKPRSCGDLPGGRVHVRVVSRDGYIPSKVVFALTDKRSGQTIQRVFHRAKKPGQVAFTLDTLPCGTYAVSVQAVLLDTSRSVPDLVVTAEEQFVTLVYPHDAPIDYYPDARTAELSGVVLVGEKRVGSCWIKLVGVYDNAITEAECSENGRFHFSSLPPGHYVAIATIPEHEPMSKPVRLNAGRNRAELSIH